MSTAQLTPREDEVLHLVSEGLTNDQIGQRLGISSRTVEAHMRTLFRKTGAKRRSQLISAHLADPVKPLTADVSVQIIPPLVSQQDRVLELERELQERNAQLQDFEEMLRKLIERQFPLYEERVEISVCVGAQPEEDHVVERHWTTPKEYLTYRVISPIQPVADHASLEGKLQVTCEVVKRDVGVAIRSVILGGRQTLMITFQPGLSEETEWTVKYQTPGLWNPLRDNRQDRLSWATTTLKGNTSMNVNTDVTVHFVLSGELGEIDVTELHGLGSYEAERLKSGDTRLSWHDTASATQRYDWQLHLMPTLTAAST